MNEALNEIKELLEVDSKKLELIKKEINNSEEKERLKQIIKYEKRKRYKCEDVMVDYYNRLFEIKNYILKKVKELDDINFVEILDIIGDL